MQEIQAFCYEYEQEKMNTRSWYCEQRIIGWYTEPSRVINFLEVQNKTSEIPLTLVTV